jgi:hypothetical protein
MLGQSSRAGRRSRRIAASSRVTTEPAMAARLKANHSGEACASAALVTGQMPPNSTTEMAR